MGRGEGGVTKNQYRGEDCLKRGGALEQFGNLRGLDKKEGGGVMLLRVVDIPMHTMSHFIFISFQIFLKINHSCLEKVIAQLLYIVTFTIINL